jgi:CRP-like cAMP-binding protein
MRTVGELEVGGALVMHDLDSAIELMEEEALRVQSQGRPQAERLAVEELDLLKGLSADELAIVRSRLVERSFAPGESLCAEGDTADRLWLITRGTVSVRMAVTEHESVRIASLAMGTVVGEMALLANGVRSATVVADDDVVCFELEEAAVRALLDEHPRIASQILRNLAREMARRVRTTSEYLRHALG